VTGGDADADAALDGARAATVRRALADRDPLPGGTGFAGRVDDRLVRDVLGRRPLFRERDGDATGERDDGDGAAWAFDPAGLADPVAVPPGHVRRLDASGEGEGERVWRLPDPRAAAPATALDAVREAVRASVRDPRPPPTADASVAVAFSGGVDSALVAAGLPGAPCYVAGYEGAHDVDAARTAAAAAGRDLTVVAVDHGDLRRAVVAVARATGRTNPMDVAIAAPLFLAAEAAAADGHDALALGQGADELFGGYAKVERAPDDDRVDADTVRGARRETLRALPDGLERDVLALRAAGVEPLFPLLDDRVVAAALPLPATCLVRDGVRKVALREAARGLVPDPVREADKKAVQYGSYASRELDRLARRAGFKRRLDDHVGRYVRALVAAADAGRDPGTVRRERSG
jgi:asparagine synthase (glutamine-hydrolysing)